MARPIPRDEPVTSAIFSIVFHLVILGGYFMNRKTKYIILTVGLLTVLAAIVVTLGGRLGGEDEAEAVETPEPESAGYVTGPEPDVTAPAPPSPPEAGGALSAPSAPGPEGTPEPVEVGNTHAVVVTAGPGGSVEPRGIVAVEDGGSLSFTFTPDEGFEVSEVKVDGRAYESPEGYSFSNVHASHTLYVVFRAVEAEPEPEPEETPDSGGILDDNISDREMTDDEYTENE